MWQSKSDQLFAPSIEILTQTSIAEAPITSGKAYTTRSSDKDLFWCRVPENSWSRIVLHDKGHKRDLTIYRTLPRDDKFTDPKGWIQGNTEIWSVLQVTTCFYKVKYSVEIRIDSVNNDNSHSWVRISRGLNKLVTDLSTRSATTTSRRLLQRKRKYVLLQADPWPKQNRQDHQLLAHLQGLYLFSKEYGLRLNQELYSINLTQWQKETLFFDTENYFEEDGTIDFWRLKDDLQNKLWNMIFRTNLNTLNFGLMMCGRARWEEAEATGKDFNFVLIRQDKKFFTFQLSNVIQDAIPLILFCNTMYWFRIISSSTLLILDVRSVYTPSQIQDWHREDKFLAWKDTQNSLRLWIPCIRITGICKSLIWPNHVLHGTSRKLGKDTKTQCIGSVFSLFNGKDWRSFKQDCKESSFFTTHSLQPCCFPEFVVTESGQIVYEKVFVTTASSQDSLRRYLDERVAAKIPNESSQNQNQFSRTGRPAGEEQFTQLEEIRHWLQSARFKPICSRKKTSTNHPATIRRSEMGNVDVFKLCGTTPEV